MGPTVDNVKIFSAVLQEQCFNHSASMKMIPAHSPIIKCMLSTKYKKWSTDSSYGRGAKSKLVLIEIIIIEVTAKNKLARLLPEDLTWNRDIATWACYTSLTACGFKWLIPSQVSFAIYRWSCIYVRKCASIVACVCMCVCLCMCILVCIIMDPPVLSEKNFSLGEPSAETDLHHSSLV